MKRFSLILAAVGGAYLLAGMLFTVLPLNQQSVQRALAAVHVYGNAGSLVLESMNVGLLLSGLFLLILAAIFYFFDRKPSSLFNWSAKRFLFLMIGLNFCLGVVYIATTPYSTSKGDDGWYFGQAKRLSQGQGVLANYDAPSSESNAPTAYWPIGYPVFLSVFFRIFGAHIWVGQILNLLLLAGIILFTYLTGQELFSPAIGARAAMVVALIPSLIFISIALLSDLFFALLLMTIVYLAQKRQLKVIQVILMGFCFGMASLTREVILLFPPVLAIYWIMRDQRWKPALIRLIIIFAVGELVLLPWQVRNYRAFGSFVPVSTHGGQMIWMGNNPYTACHGPMIAFIAGADTLKQIETLNEVQRDKLMFKIGVAYILAHPLRAVLKLPEKFFYMYYRDSQCVSWGIRASYQSMSPLVVSSMYIITDGFYYALGLALILAMIIVLKKERLTPRLWLVLGSILYFTVTNVPIFPEPRYHLPLLPFFAIIAVLGSKKEDKLEGGPKFAVG